MHELSIAQNLLTLCENELKKHKAKGIKKIEVKIGRLSGIEAHYLESAFSVLQPESVCENAEFITYLQDVVVKCKECNTTSTLLKNEFFCPKCGSSELEILEGEDMYLMRLELEF